MGAWAARQAWGLAEFVFEVLVGSADAWRARRARR